MTFSTPSGPVQALAGASLAIQPREFVSLLGPSGCGKSTLLRLVADILAPTEGRIEVGGEPPGVARRRRVFGFVFQDSTLLPWRSALQNVLLPLEIGGDRAPGPRRRARPPRAGRPARLRGGLSVAALGRDAAAGRHRARPRHAAAGAAHGRAVRRARRDHARAHEPGAAAHLAGDGDDDPLRHPQLARGGLPLRPRAGARRAARAREARVCRSRCPARATPR